MRSAFRVCVALHEDGKDTRHWLRFITIANSVSAAAEYVVSAVTAANEPDKGFTWHAINVERLDDRLALPEMREIVPDTE